MDATISARHRSPVTPTPRRRGRAVVARLAIAAALVAAASTWAGSAEAGEQFTAPSGQEAALPGAPDRDGSAVLTFYSEAGFWGQQLRTQLVPPPAAEDVTVITTRQIEERQLLGRISAVRLQCGSRDAHVMLSAARNPSPLVSVFNGSGAAHPIGCRAGSTTQVNLHANAPGLADRVNSAYFVVHAPDAGFADLSGLVAQGWSRELRTNLPAGATARGDAEIRFEMPFQFSIRQNLRLDDALCARRAALVELTVLVWGPPPSRVRGYFHVLNYKTLVDTALGDLWGCQDTMLHRLRDAATQAATRLQRQLDRIADVWVPQRARYYLIPTYGFRNFLLVGGGAPPE